MRTPIIAGNWKMHKTMPEAIEACRSLEELVKDSSVEVVVCAPFTALSAIKALGLTKVKLGAQNMYFQPQGAFTGEISPVMLRDMGCDYVIIGHSERREIFGETDEVINQKVKAALAYEITPILCCGETLEQRKSGQTETVVVSQIKKAFADISPEDAVTIVIAYEPIWAIGTGLTASAEDANAVNATIRDTIKELYGETVAAGIRIQYGGSVKPSNAKELMAQPDIDGALVGGASLLPQDFAAIVNY